MRTIRNRGGVGTTAHVVQARELLSTRISIDLPTLIAVRDGTKRVRAAGMEYLMEPGDLIAVAPGQSFDVINTPCPITGLYKADWLACDLGLIRRFLQGRPQGRRITDTLLLRATSGYLLTSFAHACEGIALEHDIPCQAAEARMTEMLGWLAHLGGYFDSEPERSVTLRLRHLIGNDLSAEWTAPSVARYLGMSEATMRRRLTSEKTQFHQLLVDIRMSHALTLLQVTDVSVTSIAYEVGYSSPSRFASRFRQRFGYAPSDVRVSEVAQAIGLA